MAFHIIHWHAGIGLLSLALAPATVGLMVKGRPQDPLGTGLIKRGNSGRNFYIESVGPDSTLTIPEDWMDRFQKSGLSAHCLDIVTEASYAYLFPWEETGGLWSCDKKSVEVETHPRNVLALMGEFAL